MALAVPQNTVALPFSSGTETHSRRYNTEGCASQTVHSVKDLGFSCSNKLDNGKHTRAIRNTAMIGT